MRQRSIAPLLAFLAISLCPVLGYAQSTLGATQGGTGSSSVPGKGKIPISDGTKYVPGDPFITANTPAIVHKAGNSIGGATVKTLTDTITATTAGNSLVVSVCSGVFVQSNVVLTITETGGSDAFSTAATQISGSTFGCGLYYAPNITAGVTAVIATFSGSSSANTSITVYVWEVSGLITLAPQMLDVTAVGTATSTTLLAGQVQPNTANEYAFAAFGVGTAAQTVTLTGTGTWNNDSGQVNPASASGLFSSVSASQWRPDTTLISAGGTITSEPWVAVLAVFRPVALPIETSTLEPAAAANFSIPVCTTDMTGTTSTVTVAAPGAGLHLYITSLNAMNSHAAVDTWVVFQDGSGGTTIWQVFAKAAGGGATQSFPVPIRVPTSGNGFYVADVTTGANVRACATGFTGP